MATDRTAPTASSAHQSLRADLYAIGISVECSPSHPSNLCTEGFRALETSMLRAPHEYPREVTIELKYVAQVVDTRETEAPIGLRDHRVAVDLLPLRLR